MILIKVEKELLLFLYHHAKIINKFIIVHLLLSLNVGGVSNVTIVKKKWSFVGFDIGPGNGPIDSIVYNKLKLRL